MACQATLLQHRQQLWWQLFQCAPKALFTEGHTASLLWEPRLITRSVDITVERSHYWPRKQSYWILGTYFVLLLVFFMVHIRIWVVTITLHSVVTISKLSTVHVYSVARTAALLKVASWSFVLQRATHLPGQANLRTIPDGRKPLAGISVKEDFS